MTNEKIRFYAKKKGVPFWQIAEALGISEPTFTRLMRKTLPAEKENEIIEIIDRLHEMGA